MSFIHDNLFDSCLTLPSLVKLRCSRPNVRPILAWSAAWRGILAAASAAASVLVPRQAAN